MVKNADIIAFRTTFGKFCPIFSSILSCFARYHLNAQFQINWTIQTENTEGGGGEFGPSWPYQSAKSPACLGSTLFRQGQVFRDPLRFLSITLRASEIIL